MPEWAYLVDAAERCRLSRGRTGFVDFETTRSAETLISLLGTALDAGQA
jgi:predicted small integral membrane protein